MDNQALIFYPQEYCELSSPIVHGSNSMPQPNSLNMNIELAWLMVTETGKSSNRVLASDKGFLSCWWKLPRYILLGITGHHMEVAGYTDITAPSSSLSSSSKATDSSMCDGLI